jgi:O-acetyl-ADP-ribose deacetylase (regulator of RNase III)
VTWLSENVGDLFTSTADAIGHGVNVDGLMGGGIAAVFRDRFPTMHGAYRALCDHGSLSPGQVMPWDDGSRWVYNIASQCRPGADARLDWLRSGVTAAVAHAEAIGLRSIALPRIGCGIGGLRWDDVLPALASAASSTTVDIEVWTL